MFFTLEGIDGSGKTTASKIVVDRLTAEGYDVILTREPGGDRIAEQLRKFILSTENPEITSGTESLLYIAARKQHVDTKIAPAVAAGKIVICDRFMDSTTAYQGYGRNQDVNKIDSIQSLVLEANMPIKTFFFDIAPNKVVSRLNNRGNLDRLELEGLQFQERVYKGYLALVKKYSSRFVVINADQDQESVANNLYNELVKVLKK
ncbi:thymidylate kinase [Spiroplasma sp. TIUS-1]|uniref:dTMP kinase n=1 Tax=Spiroplasma sp. TIUS-1 TaxID=216963 RepID=UPI001397AEDA|nr:dTMP kinase [Spiroplasma sp. TIUS-1]QHX35564.1 thymidylate kinase [Spiroplasma sp. TIUS-1]